MVTVFMYQRSAMRLTSMCSGIWLHDLCWSVVGWGYRVYVGVQWDGITGLMLEISGVELHDLWRSVVGWNYRMYVGAQWDVVTGLMLERSGMWLQNYVGVQRDGVTGFMQCSQMWQQYLCQSVVGCGYRIYAGVLGDVAT